MNTRRLWILVTYFMTWAGTACQGDGALDQPVWLPNYADSMASRSGAPTKEEEPSPGGAGGSGGSGAEQEENESSAGAGGS